MADDDQGSLAATIDMNTDAAAVLAEGRAHPMVCTMN